MTSWRRRARMVGLGRQGSRRIIRPPRCRPVDCERAPDRVIDDPAGSAAGERAIIPPLGARTLDSRPPIWTILLEAFAPKSHHQPFRSIHDRVQHAVRPPVCTFNLPAVYKHGRTFGSP